jgi:hypothetical protein
MNNFLNVICKHRHGCGKNEKKVQKIGVSGVQCDTGGGFVATRVADPQHFTADRDPSFFSVFTLMRIRIRLEL